jgi:hypothetical protein
MKASFPLLLFGFEYRPDFVGFVAYKQKCASLLSEASPPSHHFYHQLLKAVI